MRACGGVTSEVSKCHPEVSLPDHREIELLVIDMPVAIIVDRRDSLEDFEVIVMTAWSVIFVREKLAWIRRDMSALS